MAFGENPWELPHEIINELLFNDLEDKTQDLSVSGGISGRTNASKSALREDVTLLDKGVYQFDDEI